MSKPRESQGFNTGHESIAKALAEKEDLLAQRTQQVLSVEQQASELLARLHTPQQQYGEIKAAEDVIEFAKMARDHAIQELVAEIESMGHTQDTMKQHGLAWSEQLLDRI